MFKKKLIKPQLLVKDLMNDLEREENIKKRIQEYLSKPIDRPIERNLMFDSSIGMMTTAMATSFGRW